MGAALSPLDACVHLVHTADFVESLWDYYAVAWETGCQVGCAVGSALSLLDACVEVTCVSDFVVRFGIQKLDEGTAWGYYLVV